MRFVFALLFVSVSAFASIDQAPPNFPYADGEAVFVDFRSAAYRLVYDLAAKTVNVESEIVFDAPAGGYPIFDLVPDPRNVKIDDLPTEATEIADPDRASYLRILKTKIAPGVHRLALSHAFDVNVVFRERGVSSAFWTTDLTDRHYLEQYLPTNLEFDQYPMSMRVEVVNAAGKPHVLRANGVVRRLAENVFTAEFPAFYTTSSTYFHLAPAGSFASANFVVKSVDGRDLPVEVYTNGDLARYVATVKSVLAELERDYGPFPHAKVIVYGAGEGGMEYAGATTSSPTAIGHELFHSYNARGVMPADGNAGWIDEAMSSWRDRAYAKRSTPGGTTKMAGHSVYTRMTDDDAYGKGADFLAWIAGRMAADGKDFKLFLREYLRTNLYRTMTTDRLERAIEAYSGYDLADDFAKYVYGTAKRERSGGSTWPTAKVGACRQSDSAPRAENPYHPRRTKQQLLDLL